jgi:acetylornithine deacetylase
MARQLRDRGPFDHAYDVAYTTVHTGTIRGGIALNIVPRDCTFEFEIRHLPFDDPDELFREIEAYASTYLLAMRAVDPDCFIEFDLLSTMPGFNTAGDSDIAALGHACNGRPESGKVSFGSEASRFHAAAIPTIICGPGHIAQAHQPDEWVSLEQLAACEAFMRRLADRVCVA